MSDHKDLELIIKSDIPLIVLESADEDHAMQMLTALAVKLNLELHCWSITQGLQRLGFGTDHAPGTETEDPEQVLRVIQRQTTGPSLVVLCDYHPYIQGQPKHIRLLKEIALAYKQLSHTIILLSHAFDIPQELSSHTVRFRFRLPSQEQLMSMVREEAKKWSQLNGGQAVKTDSRTIKALVNNLRGLTHADCRRLIRGAIVDDGLIDESDIPELNKAKFALMDQGSVLSFEYDTEKFSEIGGLNNLKAWLEQRRAVFQEDSKVTIEDRPKGILLLGVQGSGKSLAAKAVAGLWKVPLLRLDFAALYNKFIGETERNLREALTTAELLAPCVLWLDEIEKGLHTGHSDEGTSRRVMGTFLTWLAERKQPVFVVATANSITELPPELMRKGRMDEIFFIDLPGETQRQEIFTIHLQKRQFDASQFDTESLAQAAEGFSGAEIEQAVVSAVYRSAASDTDLQTSQIMEEIYGTKPLSVIMAEQLAALRAWAEGRTVSAG